jgi:DNA mismatch endonuclease (patch repair protein)
MSDIFSKKKRSEIMSKIRATETKPERIVRKFLFANGFRYRKNVKSLPGKPDIVLSKYKTAIFINGCFWHGHKNCKAATLPQTRKKFWNDKITENKKRDAKNYKDLTKSGWKVITVWQCQIKNKSRQKRTLNLLIDKIIN